MTILITGATGNIGRHVLTELTTRGATVRALSRQADLPDPFVVGSLATFDDFHGVDSVFLFPAEEGVDDFVARATASGVTRFVVLSSLAVSGRNERDAGSASAVHHAAVEASVTTRTGDWTILRPGNFANNLLFWSFAITSGYPVRMPYPTSSQVLVHERDVALAAAIALTEPGHHGRIYELTGPATLTRAEQLATISPTTRYLEITPDEFRADVSQYMPAGVIDMLLRYWSDTVDAPEQPLPPVLGITPTTLTEWARDHKADFMAP